jgi:ribosomal protein L6P/L9E
MMAFQSLRITKVNNLLIQICIFNTFVFFISRNGLYKFFISLKIKENIFFQKNIFIFNLIISNLDQAFFGIVFNYHKKLFLHGVGYRAWVKNFEVDILYLQLGYNNLFFYFFDNLVIKARKNKILIFGINKVHLSSSSYLLKKCRIPDVYRGKGVRFKGEKLLYKIGKQR